MSRPSIAGRTQPDLFANAQSWQGDATSVNEFLRPLREQLDASGVLEVCVNRPGELLVETVSGWQTVPAPEMTQERCLSLATAVATFCDQQVNQERPLLSATLPSGERIQFVIPPAVPRGTVSITVRKPTQLIKRLDDFEREGLFERTATVTRTPNAELLPFEHELMALKDAGRYAEFLRLAVRKHQTIVVSGKTGSGKTTFMKGLVEEVPRHERLITIQDTAELTLPNHPNVVHLFYSKDAQGTARVTAKSLLEACLRMKPDRIFLAEVRGDECFHFVRLAASGHPGSITSVHAGSCALAFEQMSLMIRETGAGAVVDAATSADDFRLEDLRRRRMSVYVRIPPNRLASARPLLNLFFSQLVSLNTQALPEQDPTLKLQCLLVHDEFTAMGRVGVISSAAAFLAGYNLRLLTVVQAMSQLDAVYGDKEARTFATNHGLQILFAPREQRDADEYSAMLGHFTERATSRGRSRSFSGHGSSTVSRNDSEQRRALLLPQEFKELGSERLVVIVENCKPILGEKIRYYRDKAFTSRLRPAPAVPRMDMDLHLARVQERWRHADDELAPGQDLSLDVLAHEFSALPDNFEGPPEEIAEVLVDFFSQGEPGAAGDGGAIEPVADEDGVLVADGDVLPFEEPRSPEANAMP